MSDKKRHPIILSGRRVHLCELAETLGVDPSYLSRILNRRDPGKLSVDLAHRLSTELEFASINLLIGAIQEHQRRIQA